MNPQRTIKDLIKQLRGVLDHQQQKQLLKQYASFNWTLTLQELKNEVDRQIRKTDGLAVAAHYVELMFLCTELSGDDYHYALALRARGNYFMIGQRANREAIECYQAAASIYQMHNDIVGVAQALVGSTAALQELGRFVDAENILHEIITVFTEHKQWLPLATAYLNLAALYNYTGHDQKALQVAGKALTFVEKLGVLGQHLQPMLENNRAMSLRNLGQFEESIEASHQARKINLELGQTLEATRALSNMAFTYFLLDQYSQSLHLYELCRNEYVHGGRNRDAANTNLEYIDCLLQLRRFSEALALSHTVAAEFEAFDAQPQLTRLYMMQATAYASKKPPEYRDALRVLAQSIGLATAQQNDVLVVQARMRAAFIHLLQNEYQDTLTIAQDCAVIFHSQSRAVDEANAHLLAARAALHIGKYGLTSALVQKAQGLAQKNHQVLTSLQYQIHLLLANLTYHQKKYHCAYVEYDAAIQQLEQLRSRLMVEFNADFLEDKQSIYQECVHLCLVQLQKPEDAWSYVERAKSRALIDMLAHRIDLKIRSRHPDDDELVTRIEHLRAERNRLYRQLQASNKPSPFTDSATTNLLSDEFAQDDLLVQFTALQADISTQWNRLLSRNTDYERDAMLAHVSLGQLQTYLPDNCCLIEYFIAKGSLFVFVITASSIRAYSLGEFTTIKSTLAFLQMNLQAVPKTRPESIIQLIQQAQNQLYNLYTALLEPFIEAIRAYEHWIIVPHNFLHALPFHALYDGQQYLIEQYEISYLPCAALLHHCQHASHTATTADSVNALVLGHTQNGTLPGRAYESQLVAQLLNGKCLLDREATLASLQQEASKYQILHLATHGRFNASNPLFSGLALEGSELTTFDIFNMNLNASLVVLSACETARALVGGGDELLGLSRALFYAGAKSLVVSQWKVEDESTALLMVSFYRYLMQGYTKKQALRQAQCQLLSGDRNAKLRHPFFWSAFFLMGNPEHL